MIVLDDDLIDSCYQFAVKVTDTTYELYKKRNPSITKEKATRQHYEGKLAEWYSYFWLASSGRITSKPCMKVLKNKSYDADLNILSRGIDIHVKRCNPNLHSVLFERAEVDHILKQKNQFIMVIEYTSPKLMRMISLRAASDHKYELPINKHLHTKLAIYL